MCCSKILRPLSWLLEPYLLILSRNCAEQDNALFGCNDALMLGSEDTAARPERGKWWCYGCICQPSKSRRRRNQLKLQNPWRQWQSSTTAMCPAIWKYTKIDDQMEIWGYEEFMKGKNKNLGISMPKSKMQRLLSSIYTILCIPAYWN